jgi:hypothetical protein
MISNENISWETISCPVCENESFTHLFNKHGLNIVKTDFALKTSLKAYMQHVQ